MILKMKKSQSVTEYAILIALVIAAYAGMQLYVKRALSAKTRDASAVMSSATGTAISLTGVTGTYAVDAINTTTQYEPYYVRSSSDNYQEQVERESLQGGRMAAQSLSRSVTTRGDSGEQTMRNADAADAEWNRQ